MSKPELLHKLKITGIHCKSNMNKGPIKEHLKELLINKVVAVGEEAAPEKTKKNNPKFKSTIVRGFAETAYWKILNDNKYAVDEPENSTFKVPRAPTIGNVMVHLYL